MAIYHFSVKTISRADGRSAIAAAAYRSAEKLVCDKYGKEQDYTKKLGVEFKKIYAPGNTKSELLDRQQLWNEVEKVERRKDALLAREFEIAFPSELNANERQKMLDELCQSIVKKHGAIVDAAIHAPHKNSGSDERNYHAHIMFTTRAINENGEFEVKKFRDFSRDNGTETVSAWREAFAVLTNRHLEAAGHEARIDHRSYAEQENGFEATRHEGPAVTALRRQYEREQAKPFFKQNFEIVMPDIAVKNDRILERNAEKQFINGLDLEIIASERTIYDLKAAKAKNDAALAKERKKEQEAQFTADIERAAVRAKNFHALYNEFVVNFDADMRLQEKFDYIKDTKAYELAKQYIADFELLKSVNREPKAEKLTFLQKLKGEKAAVFFDIAVIEREVKEGFFKNFFDKYAEYENQHAQYLENREKEIEKQEQFKERDRLLIIECDKLRQKFNYPADYFYKNLNTWTTLSCGLEMQRMLENDKPGYAELIKDRYRAIERDYDKKNFVPDVYDDLFKLIDSDKKAAQSFSANALQQIESVETKVKEYLHDSAERSALYYATRKHEPTYIQKPKPRDFDFKP